MESQFNYWEEKSPSKKPGEKQGHPLQQPTLLRYSHKGTGHVQVIFHYEKLVKLMSELDLVSVLFTATTKKERKKREK